MSTLRCSLCDATNNPDVPSLGGYLGRVSKRYFKEDPDDPRQLICLACYESSADALMELNLDESKVIYDE